MKNNFDLTISIVTYKNELGSFKKLLDILTRINLNKHITVIDNSPTSNLRKICADSEINYIFNKKNIGFGAAHNEAISNIIGHSKYHLIINPDIYFNGGAIESIYRFMEKNIEVGLLMPKVIYPDGSLQYLCRLLPSPYDLLVRRLNFPPLSYLTRKQNIKYELRFCDYNKIMEVPYLSGCFMFIRTEVFRKAGSFDERFFLYLEDVDLSRRISRHYKTMYYPEVVICHNYQKGSAHSPCLFFHHIRSAIKYFNKWGWLVDKERELINKKTLDSACSNHSFM